MIIYDHKIIQVLEQGVFFSKILPCDHLAARFRGFDDVRKEIESETIRLCGNNRAGLKGWKHHAKFQEISRIKMDQTSWTYIILTNININMIIIHSYAEFTDWVAGFARFWLCGCVFLPTWGLFHSLPGVSDDPILLRIFSPKVMDLTLVDLPGLTKVLTLLARLAPKSPESSR